jgi:hypothetical protein
MRDGSVQPAKARSNIRQRRYFLTHGPFGLGFAAQHRTDYTIPSAGHAGIRPAIQGNRAKTGKNFSRSR